MSTDSNEMTPDLEHARALLLGVQADAELVTAIHLLLAELDRLRDERDLIDEAITSLNGVLDGALKDLEP